MADFWLVVFTAALAVFTAALVGVGIVQWRVLLKHEHWMQENVNVVRQIAEAATQTATTSRDSVTITAEGLKQSNLAAIDNAKAAQLHAEAVVKAERPYLVVDLDLSPAAIWSFRAINYGRTPAELLAAYAAWTVVTNESKDMPSDPVYERSTIDHPRFLPPMKQFFEFYNDNLNDRLQRDQQLSVDLRTDRQRLVYYGCLRYRDLLGSPLVHETRFCYKYDPASRGLLIAGPDKYNQRT